jgi:hypothetical protein
MREVKKGIRHAISQSKNVREWEGKEYIMFRHEPADITLEILVGERYDYAQKIIDSLPKKYQEHLIGVKDGEWSVEPIFEEPYQTMWEKELSDYKTRKSDFCGRWGCK